MSNNVPPPRAVFTYQDDPRPLVLVYEVELKAYQEVAEAARRTLADNAHLADGDQCTLRELRGAVDALKEWYGD